jgi:hypothetical protein
MAADNNGNGNGGVMAAGIGRPAAKLAKWLWRKLSVECQAFALCGRASMKDLQCEGHREEDVS